MVGAVIIAALIPLALFALKDRAPLSEREIATRLLAEHLRKTLQPKQAVIISNPYSQIKGPAHAYDFQKASEAGLRKGFGKSVDLKIAFPKLKPEAQKDATSVYVDPNIKTPLSYLVADDAFDEIVRQFPNADVFVSLVGLPANITVTPIWMRAGSPRLALLLPDFRILGDASAIRWAFKSGKIPAAVIGSEKNFVVVTAENIDQHLPALLR